jgi:glycosyltransferase involved in cell wall biosynthesis
MAVVRMLYVVGGRKAAARVDVSDLFANRLAAMGFEIDWVILDPAPSAPWRKETWHGARAHWIGRSRRQGIQGVAINKLIELAAGLRTFWLALKGDYDIIQVRDKFVSAVLALLAARLRGAKFVYWLSYPFPESRLHEARAGRSRIPWLSYGLGKATGWLLYRVILPRADHVFVQSQQMLQDVAQQGIPRALMSPVPMGISESLLQRPPAVVEPNTLCYLGTLARVRRLEVLIQALSLVRKRHPQARLIFIGTGDIPADRAFLEQVTASMGLQDAVEFTGLLPVSEALDRVMRAAVCLSPFFPTPILRSTSPTKLVEYLALGRPVVVNDHPEQRDVILESGAGLCVEWSAQAFADAISHLLADPESAERMGAKGPSYVQRHRLYSIIAQDVAARYHALLCGRAHPRGSVPGRTP